MAENEKIVVISTIGNENPEKATLPFVLATAAQAMDVEVVMFLQASAVVLAKNGEAEKVNAKGFLALKELIDTYIKLGGKLNLCSPCLKERNISKDDLIDGCEIIAAGTIVSEVLSAGKIITY
jgi:Predicted peroxiredoxins